MRFTRALVAVLAATAVPLAYADVFKCVDANGRTTYTNDQTLGRGCKQLAQDLPVSSVPAPRAPAAKPASPATAFPRVSSDDQRARDDTRRQVLEKELTDEEEALSTAKAALAEQESVRLGNERNYQKVLDRLQPFKDKIELHQRNIEALKREIANLK